MKDKGQEEKKKYEKKYSKEIALPMDVSERYKEYCRITKMNLTEPIRVMVMDSLPRLHNSEQLDNIIEKVRNRDSKTSCEKLYIRLPDTVMTEINTYCSFFKLHWQRCHFLYYLIEDKLIDTIEDVLNE